MFRLLSFFAIFTLSLIATPALASSPVDWREHVKVINSSNEIVDSEPVGQWYPVSIIPSGEVYSIRLSNPLDERVRIIVSVNGLDPFTGRKSIVSEGGFVLEPGETRSISKWKPGKKKAPVALNSPSGGLIHRLDAAVFREVNRRPLITPHAKIPPPSIHPTKWVPPRGTSFYPSSPRPQTIVHYRVGPGAPLSADP